MKDLADKCYIDGKWTESVTKEKFTIFNPASGEAIAEVAKAVAADTNRAIAAAAKAFPSWSAKLPKERSKIIYKLAELVTKHQEELAQIMVLENGKSINEARAEITYSLGFVEWFAEEAKRIYGEVVPSVKAGQRLFTIRQPVGVAVAITPWNFPLAMIVRKALPALAAGCCIVVKPSEETPLTALAFTKLVESAGVPPGVFNVLCGDAPAIGDAMTASTTVRMLSFTGSTRVGKLLMGKAANTVKKVALELGGNAPFIVFEDADLESAVAGVVASKLRNGGQSCICTNRIYVHESIADRFVEKLKGEFANIKIGDGADANNQLGPLINKAAVKKISDLIEDAKLNGADIVYAADISDSKYSKGCYVAPTIVLNHSANTLIESTEIFGPIASVFTFKNEEEVIKRANNTNYGLASYFYTKDKDRIWRVSEALEYGMVAVNDVMLSSEMTSFGGVKESGIGREGGRHGINEFLEEKFIAIS